MNHTAKPVVIGICDKQPAAIALAVREARLAGSPLRVVHSAGMPVSMLDAQSVVTPGFLEESGRAILDDARTLVEELDRGLDVTYVLSRSAVLETLEAEAKHAALVVLGADDVDWYERLFRTRIAGYLSTHAACPVAVVPEREHPTSDAGDVVVTLDGETAAAGPLAFAFAEAEARGRELHVLHAIPPGTTSDDAAVEIVNVAEILAGWRERFPDVPVVETFAVGQADDDVVRATGAAGLVVVGRPHDRGLAARLTKPVTVKILERAECPVVVVPLEHRV